MKLFDIKSIYPDFDYPYQLKKVAKLDLLDFDYWFIMDSRLAENYTHGIKERFLARNLIPFAKRADCDDVACFEIGKPGKIEIIHDFCELGWEQRGEYDDVTCLHLDKFVTQPGTNLWNYLDDWYAMKEKYIHGRTTKEEYDHWRYNFPNDGTSVLTAKVPPERFL